MTAQYFAMCILYIECKELNVKEVLRYTQQERSNEKKCEMRSGTNRVSRRHRRNVQSEVEQVKPSRYERSATTAQRIGAK